MRIAPSGELFDGGVRRVHAGKASKSYWAAGAGEAGGELTAVWKQAEKWGWPFGPALQLLILTGARRQEIAALHRSGGAISKIELNFPKFLSVYRRSEPGRGWRSTRRSIATEAWKRGKTRG